MQKNNAYNLFLNILHQKVPDKKALVKRLSEFLPIEKEAIYRRLRGTVPFSFSEITTIALNFDISLDNLLKLEGQTAHTVSVRLATNNHWKPDKVHYFMLWNFIKHLKGLSKYDKSEYISISNTIPQIFYIAYPHLYRFYLFKWQYEEGYSYEKTPYKEVYPTEELTEINKEYEKYSKTANSYTIIWDKRILRLLVEDILYFYEIRLLTLEEVENIKEDLLALLKNLQKNNS